ncbi:MAG: type II toxin-antitoxin system VapC family toxin [Chloroflexi bacterium]|nr:type II toxin-antitoxin system VapC family toxin [Chloroflexota bacterium]
MDIYLDNCCFNRPFDDQSLLRIHLESEAKLSIQEDILAGFHRLIWSYILDYENSQNPFRERREQIARWRKYAVKDVEENEKIIKLATMINRYGIKKLDALHIACAINAEADYFLTTDDGILKKASTVKDIKITDPIGFIKEVST